MMAKPTLMLMVCHNHAGNGMPKGVCMGLSLGDPDRLTLESPYADAGLKCEVGEHTIRLGKSHTWQHHGRQTWVGNWLWDAVTVTTEVAADILNFAVAKGYRPTVGAALLWAKIDRGEPFVAADFYADVPMVRGEAGR